MVKKNFPVLNMHCAGCANNVERTVRKLPGVIEASVNFATNTLTVSYESDKLAPGEIRAAVLTGEDAAALRHLHLSLEEVGVRHDADVDEDGIDRQLARLTLCLVVDGDARQMVLTVQSADLCLEQHFDLRIGKELVLRCLVGAQLRAMDQVELLGVLRQEVRRIDCGIAAAHDGDDLVLIHVAVAEFTVVDTAAAVLRLFLERQLAALHAGGDDDDLGLVDIALRLDDLRLAHEVDALDHVELIDFGTGCFGLLLDGRHEVAAADLREARVILDADGVGNLPADDGILEHERREIRTPCVERCRKAGHAGTDDDDIFCLAFLRHTIPPLSVFRISLPCGAALLLSDLSIADVAAAFCY